MMEKFQSLKYICYGFVCLIKYEFIANKRIISPWENNQDVCEHQFANVRRNCFSYGAPNKTEAMASMVK